MYVSFEEPTFATQAKCPCRMSNIFHMPLSKRKMIYAIRKGERKAIKDQGVYIF